MNGSSCMLSPPSPVCIFAVKHNNVLPNAHFRKEWQERIKTWLDQPARKKARRLARRSKAAAIAPRPAAGAIRPVVRCQTVRYNTRVRAGRGFTLDEVRAAGVSIKLAPTIGIAVDHRRRNKSEAAFDENVARLKAFLGKMVLFPRKSGKKHVKAGEATAEVRKTLTQHVGAVFPIRQPSAKVEFAAVADAIKSAKEGAYNTLRQERCNARIAGRRAKKAAEKAAEKPTEKAEETA